ncbi:SIR2 family NAD-dependent protein deacylase [Pseudomonas sp. NPDC096950]|uniref:SIR2 family NAD-dependent protein deacylase n=1 Tax=Pseudomonas sp. NPDC096950 TaxID=3364485 RepID=UPI00383B553C
MIEKIPDQQDAVYAQAASSSFFSEIALLIVVLAVLLGVSWVIRARRTRTKDTRREDVPPEGQADYPSRVPLEIPETIAEEVQFDFAIAAIKRAKSVLIITGAGISADSGLPTYRGAGGLYTGSSPESSPLSAIMLHRSPDAVWRHLSSIERASRTALPNSAHLAIAEYQRKNPNCWLMTQNIDGLHLRAGSPPERVLEVHGNVREVSCMSCGAICKWPVNLGDAAYPLPCAICNGQIRPSVVLYGEMIPEATQDTMQSKISTGQFDVVVAIGTTLSFPYIKRPLQKTRANGGACIEVNPGESEGGALVHAHIKARAAEFVPILLSYSDLG